MTFLTSEPPTFLPHALERNVVVIPFLVPIVVNARVIDVIQHPLVRTKWIIFIVLIVVIVVAFLPRDAQVVFAA